MCSICCRRWEDLGPNWPPVGQPRRRCDCRHDHPHRIGVSPAQSAATAGTEQTTPITAVSGREHAASVSDEARLVPPVAELAPSISAVSARTASDSEHTANAVLAGETSSSQTRLSVSGGDAGTPEKVSAPEPQGVLGSGLGLTVSLATGLGGVVEDIVSEVGAIPVVDGVTESCPIPLMALLVNSN